MNVSRLELLPPLLQQQIFAQIYTPKDLLSLLAVNKCFMETTKKYSFPNLERLNVYMSPGVYWGGPSKINGDAIRKQYLPKVIEQLWINGSKILSLELTGMLEGEEEIFEMIKSLMSLFPRSLKKLHLRACILPMPALNRVKSIIENVSDSLEEVNINIWCSGLVVRHNGCVEALGKCRKLKELYLEQLSVQEADARIIFQDKCLSTVVIRQGGPHYARDDIFFGFLEGISSNITQLDMELTQFFVYDFPDKTFPLLTTFTARVHCQNEIRSFQKHLFLFVKNFPALDCILIKNEQFHPHLEIEGEETGKAIISFFDRVQLFLSNSVQERKFRVSCCCKLYVEYNLLIMKITLQVILCQPTEGSLQKAFDILQSLKDNNRWTVIRKFHFLPSKEMSFVGIKKGPIILELAEPPLLAPED